MGKKIPHIIDDDGQEKKLCSRCKEYKTLDEYNHKKDRWDGLSNECYYCLSLRNKRRHNANFTFPDHVKTRAEVEEYLDLCRYKRKKNDNEDNKKE